MRVRNRFAANALLMAAVGWASATANATDIFGVQNAALDQPMINALLRPGGGGSPLSGIDPISGDPSFNILGFLDTGASGVLLSKETANGLGVAIAPGVTYEDVGIGGSSSFNVSVPLRVELAPFHPLVDVTDQGAYTQHFGPLRAQVAPQDADLLTGPLDVFGMPTMQGKVVVIDPKPLNTLTEQLRTYIYNPGTAFNPRAEVDPGIPHTNRQVALTFASFSRFTQVKPAGAEGPTEDPNPFIGPNPMAKVDPNVPPGNVPGVTLKLGGKAATGSFLLDTGSQASMISKAMAAQLGVRERKPQSPGDAPVLEQFDPAHPELPGTELPNQFVITVAGTGGQQAAAGFFLDSLLLRTTSGNAANEDDPQHLRYVHAPVLVADITLRDPITFQTLTLDGVFGMNFLVATQFFSEPFTLGEEVNPSPFDWIVFDAQHAVLGLDVTAVPEPGAYVILFAGLTLLICKARYRRRC